MEPPVESGPVFVDSSGSRRRLVKIVGATIAVPVVVYLVLLGSSVLGGPSPDTNFIPLPGTGKSQSDRPPTAKVTKPPAGKTPNVKPTETSSVPVTPVVAVSTHPSSTPRPATPTASSTPLPSAPPSPTNTPSRGKPTAPPGRTKSPPAKP